MGALRIVAVVDGVEVLESGPRVFVVDRFGEAIIVGGRAKRRPSKTVVQVSSSTSAS